MIEPQYYHQIKKGSTVTLWNGSYRVQEDRGHLYVVMKVNGQRKKKTITPELFPEPGSLQDFIFHQWFQDYTEQEFYSFASAELSWLGIN